MRHVLIATGLVCGLLAGSAAHAREPDPLPPSVIFGSLYSAVELGHVFADQKTFADAIPKEAPNLESAYAFMNYMMTPQVIADVSNFKRYANANAAAQPLVLPAVKDDAAIYPTAAQREHLTLQSSDTAEQTRAITRIWQKFKTGQ